LAGDTDKPLRSATAAASFGAVRLTLPADAMTLAMALVHELQHAKLYALAHLVPLVVAGSGQLLHVPWRDDPRPVEAALQGAYAHLALIGFWHRHAVLGDIRPTHDPIVEFAWAREAVRRTVVTLCNSDALTPAGSWFVAGMRRQVEQWEQVQVNRRVLTAVDDNLTAHRSACQLSHPDLA
jgi:HEXXH motif-containing protein